MELLFLLIGIGGTCLYYRKKVKARVQLDAELEKRNDQLRCESLKLEDECNDLSIQVLALGEERFQLNQEIDARQAEIGTLRNDKAALEKEKVLLKESIEDLEKVKNELYSAQEELAQVSFEKALERMSEEFQKTRSQYEEQYTQTLKEAAESVQEQIQEKSKALQVLLEEFETVKRLMEQEKNQVNAAVEANKRAEAERTEKDFYRLNIPEIDLAEIEKLKEVLPYVRNPEALNKALWKVYYEKPYTDLVGRVIGSQQITGIYKITNITNQMCYVGQAVNIAERWKQHIKRGMGAEAPTKNKLYPAMMSFGVENFTFEIIQECKKSELDEREDYWQDFFKAKEFGYSIK